MVIIITINPVNVKDIDHYAHVAERIRRQSSKLVYAGSSPAMRAFVV